MSRGSGGPFAPARNGPDDGELTVYGLGIGSAVGVTTEQVRACAATLRTQAGRARDAGSQAFAAAQAMVRLSHLTAAGPGAVAQAEEVRATADRRAHELERLAEALEAAAQRYEDAEAAFAATIWELPRPPSWLVVLHPWAHIAHALAAAGLDAADHDQQPWALTRHGAGMVLEETIWALTGTDDGIPAVAGALSGLVRTLGVGDGVEVERVAGPGSLVSATGRGGSTHHDAVDDLAGVVSGIGDLYPDKGPHEPGTVQIDRITAADGSVSWLVLVPGTQGDLHSSNPLDWAGNPAAMLGQTTAASAIVVAAMRAAGIKPGEPVMIGGHSQGGLVAVNAAAEVAGEIDVAGVVTVGSPTGHLDLPAGAEVLSLEHVEDPTPGLDNAPNEVSEGWTTVERTLHTSADPASAAVDGWRGSHDVPTYVTTAEMVDASGDEAVQDFFANVADVLDDGGTAQSAYYQGTRS